MALGGAVGQAGHCLDRCIVCCRAVVDAVAVVLAGGLIPKSLGRCAILSDHGPDTLATEGISIEDNRRIIGITKLATDIICPQIVAGSVDPRVANALTIDSDFCGKGAPCAVVGSRARAGCTG